MNEVAKSNRSRGGGTAAGGGLPAVIPPSLGARNSENVRSPGFIRRRIGAAAAILAVAGAAAGAIGLAASEHRRQANLVTQHTSETQALVQAVGALSERISAVEGVKSRDDLSELRRSIGEMKANVAGSRELSQALAQLSERVEALNREESARVERLRERIDGEPGEKAAELSARIEKLEKKVIAAAPPPAPAAQPNPPPKLGPNVSMETTGSIERPRPLLQSYVVLGARKEVALVEGRYGERAVRPGDILPGAGRVERIERQGGAWVVLTNQGLIAEAEPY